MQSSPPIIELVNGVEVNAVIGGCCSSVVIVVDVVCSLLLFLLLLLLMMFSKAHERVLSLSYDGILFSKRFVKFF